MGEHRMQTSARGNRLAATPAFCARRHRRCEMSKLMGSLRGNWGPDKQKGAIGYVFAWLLGIPVPLLLVIFLLRGCT